MKLDVHMRMRLKAEDRLFQLDVTFQSAKNLIVIFGPSGAGKSVTIQAIAGLIKPEQGRISLDGRVLFDSESGVNLAARERNVAYVFQDYALFPINLWDMRIKTGHKVELELPNGFTTMLLVLQGTVLVNGTEMINRKELTIFEREGDVISLEATSDTICLVLNGEPIDEPIVGQGPFVMNTQDEIDQAMADYHAGRF